MAGCSAISGGPEAPLSEAFLPQSPGPRECSIRQAQDGDREREGHVVQVGAMELWAST